MQDKQTKMTALKDAVPAPLNSEENYLAAIDAKLRAGNSFPVYSERGFRQRYLTTVVTGSSLLLLVFYQRESVKAQESGIQAGA